MTAPVARPDIADRGDIADLVTAFYRRAFADALLGPIFVDVAKVDMSVHLPVMCDFWETVLLRAGRYHRNALRPHLELNSTVELTAAHFERWLALWTATVDERHRGEKAELAKTQATRIAGSISRRLREQPATQHVTIQRRRPDEDSADHGTPGPARTGSPLV
ncbi:MAG: group III truncated hemoglobin [Pseudonocardiaceae bacterium]